MAQRIAEGISIEIKREEKICLCGYNSFIISNVYGRKLDSIYLENGFEINALMLLEVIAEVNNCYNDIIIHYKYEYYKSENTLVCYIKIKNESWYDNVRRVLINTFFYKLKQISVIKFNVEKFIGDIEYGRKFRIVEMKE